MPKFDIRCSAKASLFAYPPPIEPKRKEEREKVETAVLSITGRKKGLFGRKTMQSEDRERERKRVLELQKEREKEKKKEEEPEKMEVDDKPEEDKKKASPEAPMHFISNPGRVVKQQLRTLSNTGDVLATRYFPLKPLSMGGIIMLRNTRPEEREELVATVAAGGMTAGSESISTAPDTPAPFEIELKDY